MVLIKTLSSGAIAVMLEVMGVLWEDLGQKGVGKDPEAGGWRQL